MVDSLPTVDFDAIGPSVGDRLPDIRLLNQHGQAIDVHAERRGRRALFVIFRSADW